MTVVPQNKHFHLREIKMVVWDIAQDTQLSGNVSELRQTLKILIQRSIFLGSTL
jgi:hypothetical protein